MALIPKRRPSARAAASLAALAAAASLALTLLGSSCGLLQDDAFPEWLPYAEAWIDIRALSEKAGFGPIQDFVRLEHLAYTEPGGDEDGASRLFAFCNGPESGFLVSMDGGSLAFEKAWLRGTEAPLSLLGPAMKGSVGGFISGGLELDLGDLYAAPLVITAGSAPKDSWIFSTGRSGDPAARNFLVYGAEPAPGAYRIAVTSFSEDFSLEAGPVLRALDDAGRRLRVLDAEYAGGRYRLLVQTEAGGYVVSFPTEAALLGPGPVLTDPEAEITGPFALSDAGSGAGANAWLSADGVVALTRYDGFRLTRYAYGSPLVALDTLAMEDGWDYAALSFDPSGTWWFLHDRLAGRLVKMRTWW
jgi:hypothetical protein